MAHHDDVAADHRRNGGGAGTEARGGLPMTGRVWIVSELYYPEETSTGYLLTRIAEGLAAHRPVSVLCAQPTYSARGTRAPAVEDRHGVAIRRCRGTTLNKDILPFRFVTLITISVAIFVSLLLRVSRGDCVIVVTNPPA